MRSETDLAIIFYDEAAGDWCFRVLDEDGLQTETGVLDGDAAFIALITDVCAVEIEGECKLPGDWDAMMGGS